MIREKGFYWVSTKYPGFVKVEVAEWNGEAWDLPGVSVPMPERGCEVLSERLTPPERPRFMTMMEQLHRQIFKDHLVLCRQRLADARASVATKSGVDLGNAILLMHERQHEFRRALDFMWKAQDQQNEVPFDMDEHVDELIARHYRP